MGIPGPFLWRASVKRSSKLLIAKMPEAAGDGLLCAWVEEGRVAEIWLPPREQAGMVGNIYVGQVERVVPAIHGAFVRIGADQVCFYDLADQEPGRVLKAGERILVQVLREQMRGKPPTVTTRLSLAGRYLILTVPDDRLRLSKKLSGSERARLKGSFESPLDKGYGILVRTNARGADRQEILRELELLEKRLWKIRESGRAQPAGSLVDAALPFYLSVLQDARIEELEEIVTDVPDVYGKIVDGKIQDLPGLRLYEDPSLSLYQLYGLGHVLAGIQKPRVWLRSGGSITIEQTKAFVSIDVDTGGYAPKKEAQEVYRRTNLEAAEQIAFQLRLRNLSGTILVDFINMKEERYQEELMQAFQSYLDKDPVRAKVVDMTALKIVEVTRQKVRRPVAEELKALHDKAAQV